MMLPNLPFVARGIAHMGCIPTGAVTGDSSVNLAFCNYDRNVRQYRKGVGCLEEYIPVYRRDYRMDMNQCIDTYK